MRYKFKAKIPCMCERAGCFATQNAKTSEKCCLPNIPCTNLVSVKTAVHVHGICVYVREANRGLTRYLLLGSTPGLQHSRTPGLRTAGCGFGSNGKFNTVARELP